MSLPTAAVNKPPSTRRNVCTLKHTELHSNFLRNIENFTDLVIGEPLVNVTLVTLSHICGEYNLVKALMRSLIDDNFWLH